MQNGFQRQRATADLLTNVRRIRKCAVHLFMANHPSLLWLQLKPSIRCGMNNIPSYGLPHKLCHWTYNFLSGRTLLVLTDGLSFKLHLVKAGVPQVVEFGTTLSS